MARRAYDKPAGHNIIVIGGSAGGVDGVRTLSRHLPSTLPAAVFVVLHIGASKQSDLPLLLARTSRLPIQNAKNGDPIESGRIYIAPPDHHLLLERGKMCLSRGPKENRTRPAINPLFRSAASAYGARVVGVILSGMLDDGAAGLWEIKNRGGVAVVQDPGEARFDSMPKSALAAVAVDHCVKMARMPALLTEIAGQSANRRPRNASARAMISDLTCPECRGPLWELKNGKSSATEYQCRVKHRFSVNNLLADHEATEERAVWTAVLALEEGAVLARRLAEQPTGGNVQAALRRAARKERMAAQLKEMIETAEA